MGFFDRWRRKKKSLAPVKLTESRKPKTEESVSSVSEAVSESEDVAGLIAEYERLVQRREELLIERQEITATLDSGELNPDEFRKELMSRIQEAATVSENLQNTAAKLTALGYRGYS
jgi:predicted transcriptional regulator